jgi:thiamine biosynthesis lipoprotein ApbE
MISSLARPGLAWAVSLLVTVLSCAGQAGARGEFRFHRDGVLGTSFDLAVATVSSNEAARVERAALDEIERLRKILSTYDTNSDISRLNRATGPVVVAAELAEVLTAYEGWAARSGGAYSGQLGEIIGVWKAAEKSGALPTAAALTPLAAAQRQPGWTLEAASRTVTRRAGAVLNIDSLGKGYILSKAAAAARAQSPATYGLMLNIGGDIFASGSRSPTSTVPWRVAVANPRNPADNLQPLTRLSVADRAVSTSAGYARGFKIGKARFSHILDPRTGRPATNVASATVVAADNATANALATTLCVLTPEEGLRLVRDTPGAECLIVTPDGKQSRSANFASLETKRSTTQNLAKPGLWPAGFEVSVAITLKTPGPDARKIKRPYVALWIEDAAGRPVRTVVLWGNKSKYFRDLPVWWKFAQDDTEMVGAVTRATRAFGTYNVVWDGRDDLGEPLPPGTYTVVLEVTREHGTHARKSVRIDCGAAPARALIPAGSEFDAAPVVYGPRQAP